ncbi:MAG: LUD domain-containing protein, partial [Atribacterota bacterium]|nr:LUD domain-containing protein [Atribacterota bacterium]
MDELLLKEFYAKRSKVAVNALKANNFNALFYATKEEAVSKAISFIPKNATVGIGGSISIREIGLLEIINK